ncbi:MAG: AI-2E family transporter [Gloeomargarita sp. SKYBB_i_bin120]|nr:AI-2E family transporter [Gloeomargarita sp. SKYB120]MDW8178526.1 AI-2E family transporter [Gloeomargarita sp. SKYBB_i_bin120]
MRIAGSLPPWLTWGLALPLVVLNGWLLLTAVNYLQPLVNILVIATVLSFLLNYPIELLQSWGMRRSWAVLVVLLAAVSGLTVAGITLVPVVIKQVNELVVRLPNWLASGTAQLESLEQWAQAHQLNLDLSGLADQLTTSISRQLKTVTARVLGLAVDTVSWAVDVILTLVLTLYLVLYGERLWTGLFSWLPERLGSLVRESLHRNFYNYFLGQATIGVVLGSLMTLAFVVLQVPLALLFGLIIGLASLVPFGGAVSIVVISFLLSLQNAWLGLKVLATALLLAQLNEHLIAPRILGDVVGLNPVWIILSLLLGAKLAGLLGVFIAVPVAASLKSVADSLRMPSPTLPEKVVAKV